MLRIINIRQCPEWLERAADYFSSRWNIDRQLYIDSMLESGGLFVFGDYTVSRMERQQELLAANAVKRREQGIADGEFCHFDTPFTKETEMRLMKEAGFVSAEIVRQWENTTIINARK